MTLEKALHWRYAPKRMTGAKVPDEHIENIIKAAQLAPTSMGLQPFHIYMITDQELKEKIKPIAYHQAQILESSHLLIFCAYNSLNEQHIDNYITTISEVRNVSLDSLSDYKKSMMRFLGWNTNEQIQNWAANQVFLAMGFALAQAALLEVDITPMEGFDNDSLDELLMLKKQNLHSIAILALGYRDEENDFLAKSKKVRKPLNELVTII